MTHQPPLPPSNKTSPSRAGTPNPCVPLPSVSDRQLGRSVSLIIVVILSTLSACRSDTTGTAPIVKVCTTTTAPEECAGDQTEFTVGDSLSAHLVTTEPFETQQMIGRILRLSGTDTITLGARMISVEADQRTVVQNLPFHEFGQQAAGTFLIEFVDNNNRLIAKKEIIILDNS